jgi:hypothetical protein
VYVISAKGSKSERRQGTLAYDNKPVAGAAEYDRIRTPWGVMQHFGNGRDWNSGWLLKQTYDEPINAKKGRLLPDPEVWTKRIAERKQALVEGVENFNLLLRYCGPEDKPFYRLWLSVPTILRARAETTGLTARIDKETALKIIDWMADSGVLGAAEELSVEENARRQPAGPCYVVNINGGKLSLVADLGWEMPMLKSLYGIRGILAGDAAKQMDILMTRLNGFIKEWTGTAYRPPD